MNNMTERNLLTALLFVLGNLVLTSAHSDEIKPGVFRTPDRYFENLPGYDFEPNYMEISGYRLHYLDEGPTSGPVVLLFHGEPTWSYLYRKMIPIFTDAGYRVLAPDLIGFGRSDKPASRQDYSYQMHVDIMTEFVARSGLREINAFFQDWGGLIGLRIVAANPDWFARVAAGNTGFPLAPGDDGIIRGGEFTEIDPQATMEKDDNFQDWLKFSQTVPDLQAGYFVQWGTMLNLPADILAAYDAPFPSAEYKAGARVFPTLVFSQNATNRAAWESLEKFEKPFLTTFSDSDSLSTNGFVRFRERIPGAQNQPHTTITNARHFLQEDKGEELANYLISWFGN